MSFQDRCQKCVLSSVVRNRKDLFIWSSIAPVFREGLIRHTDGHAVMSDRSCKIMRQMLARFRTCTRIEGTVSVPVDYEVVVVVMLMVGLQASADKERVCVVQSVSGAHNDLAHRVEIH